MFALFDVDYYDILIYQRQHGVENPVQSNEHNIVLQGHDMIVNAMCCVEVPQLTIFTGGYDRIVKRWDLQSQSCTGSSQVETVVNALASCPTADSVYVSGEAGYLTRIDFK